jgi:hypothetical protein
VDSFVTLQDPKIRHEEEETGGAVAAGDGDKVCGTFRERLRNIQ